MSCYGDKPADFIAMQPNGQIPVAVIDGTVLRQRVPQAGGSGRAVEGPAFRPEEFNEFHKIQRRFQRL